MTRHIETDLCVIGAGSGGLSVAAGASQLGLRVVLVERGRMGGDCLNYGCVPSKALLAAAHAAASARRADRLGVRAGGVSVDFAAVHAHVHGVIAAIAPMDSQARFEGLGVTVLRGTARFTGRRSVTVESEDGDRCTVRGRIVVIATGSRAAVPPVPGLADTPFLTNETIFDLTERPAHLLVLGGGPVGVEMAQAHARLGSRVTLVEAGGVLGRDDPEAVDVIRAALAADGVELREGKPVAAAEAMGAPGAPEGGVRLTLEGGETVEGSHLLVAAGRVPNVDALDLEAAGVAFDRRGVSVDAGLRTTNRRVWAVGDVAGGPQFTHVAGYHAGILVRRALFRLFWTRVDDRALPRVTYTEPELAQVGLTEAEARERHDVRGLRFLRWSFAENDRAQAERSVDGLIKVVATRRGRILGATIAGPGAGELIQPWVLAIANRLKLAAMASYIAPYPTLGEVSKRAAGSFFTPALFSRRTRRIVRFLMKLP